MIVSDDVVINRARSYSAGIPGRALSSARDHHFVIDDPVYAGGPGEELTANEAFLTSISACGVLVVEAYAREHGIRLSHVEADIEARRVRSVSPPRFERITLRFRFSGPSRDEAEELARHYEATCPLYRTVAVATDTSVEIEVDDR